MKKQNSSKTKPKKELLALSREVTVGDAVLTQQDKTLDTTQKIIIDRKTYMAYYDAVKENALKSFAEKIKEYIKHNCIYPPQTSINLLKQIDKLLEEELK